MTAEDIKDAVKAAMDEHRSAFYVEEEVHYNHHKHMEACLTEKAEWKRNHEFVTGIRENENIVNLLDDVSSEWADNHRFTSEVRNAGNVAKNFTMRVLITFIVGAVIAALARGFLFK